MGIFNREIVITTCKSSQVPVLVRLLLLRSKLEESAGILKLILRKGEWIYHGDRHIAVVTVAGGRRIVLRALEPADC